MSIFEYDKEKEEKKLRKAEFEAGRREGETRGAFGMIEIYKDLSTPDTQILEKLQQKLQITTSEAQKYLELYQKKSAQ